MAKITIRRTARRRECAAIAERTSTNIVTLAKILRGVIRGLHDAAPDHCQCPLNGTDACFGYGGALDQLKEIIGK